MDSLPTSETPEAKLHFLDYWRIIRIRKTVILSVFLLVVVTTTVVTFFLPEWYSSKARITVEKDAPDVMGIDNRQSYVNYDPFWLQTEFEKMKSTSVLYPVIADMKLTKTWAAKHGMEHEFSPREVYDILYKQIEIKVSKNTSVIEIWVYSQDREEAARLANAIANKYKDLRDNFRKESKGAGITQLEHDYQAQEALVLAQQTNVDMLREANKIPDMGPDGLAYAAPTLNAETVRRWEEMRVQAKGDYTLWETLYNRLKAMKVSEQEKAIPTAVPDQELTSLLENLHGAQQKFAEIEASDLGKKSEEYRESKALVETVQQQVHDKIEGILAGLSTRVSSLKDKYDALGQEFESSKTNDIEKASQYRPYYEAKKKLERLNQVKNALEIRIAAEQVDKDLPTPSRVQFTDEAEPSVLPVRPNKPLNILLGVVVGLVVGIGLAFFIEYLDTSVKTIDDVEKALQAPVLGVIPQNVTTILDEGPESPHAEAYRVLRTNLLFSRKDDKLNSLTVVSGGAGEGKSTTLFNLATVFAQNGHRVLVVDSDLRRPSIHKILKISNSIGLTNYLLKQNTLEEVIQTSKLPTLDVLPSGKLPSSSMGILSSVQMKLLVTELKRRYDFVFFDSPPIMGVSDASILASEVDMVLQVIQYRRYPQPMTVRAKQMIQKVGGNLIGLVLNNINMSQDENYYYYSGYYYNYYNSYGGVKPEEASGEGAGGPPQPPTNGQPPKEPGRGPSRSSIKPKF